MSMTEYAATAEDYAVPANDNNDKAYTDDLDTSDFLMLWFYDLDTEIMSYDMPI